MPKEFVAEIEMRSPEDLTPFGNNPKSHPQAQIEAIASSISTYGFNSPVVINSSGVVLSGHGRLEAARRLGLEQVPVIVKDDLTPAAERGYRIADNKVAQSDWLDEALAQELKELEEIGFDLELTGFDSDEIDELLKLNGGEGDGEGTGEEEDEVPDVEEVQPRDGLVLGSIWQLGRHKIGCLDSTDEVQVRRLLGDQFNDVGMVWADPPYGINAVAKDGGSATSLKPYAFGGVKGKGKLIAKNKYAPIIGDESGDTAERSFSGIIELGGIQIWWGANNYTSVLPSSTCWIVWNKETNGNLADAELAWCNHQSSVRLFTHTWNGMVKASEHGEKRVHPTQKPCALFVWCASKYGKPGDNIFDPFCGSGISIVGCETLNDGRSTFAMELSEVYVEVTMRRWEKLTGLTAQLVSSA